MNNINLQDFTINLFHLNNIKRNCRNNNTYEEYEKEINKFINKYTLDNKIKIKIYIIKDNFYISYNYIKKIINNKFTGNIPILIFLTKYLFTNDTFNRTFDFNQLKKELNYKYIQNNNKIIKVFNLTKLINKEELDTLYKFYLSKNNNTFEEDIIKLCGIRNTDQQEYYKFIFKNIQFQFINYVSDIDKLKEYYDKKIKELTEKVNEYVN